MVKMNPKYQKGFKRYFSRKPQLTVWQMRCMTQQSSTQLLVLCIYVYIYLFLDQKKKSCDMTLKICMYVSFGVFYVKNGLKCTLGSQVSPNGVLLGDFGPSKGFWSRKGPHSHIFVGVWPLPGPKKFIYIYI